MYILTAIRRHTLKTLTNECGMRKKAVGKFICLTFFSMWVNTKTFEDDISVCIFLVFCLFYFFFQNFKALKNVLNFFVFISCIDLII